MRRYKIISITLFVPCLGYAASHHPQAFLKSISGTPNEGQAIVEHFCMVCHSADPQISLGAPRIGHTPDWRERLKQSHEQLFDHTSNGIGAMPPRGGCFECSDDQLKSAMRYLINPKK